MDATGDEKRQLTSISVSGHFVRWSPDGAFIYFNSSGIEKVPFEGGDPEPLPEIKGGSHISFSPTNDVIIDVVGHTKIWASPVGPGKPVEVFSFDDPDVRIDYPVWSPDGHWLLFDRVKPQGGDIWLLENFE